MNTDQLRDRLAELTGWIPVVNGGWKNPRTSNIGEHPFRDGNLNSLAAEWKSEPLKDWYWGKCWGEMVAQKKGTYEQVTLPETGDFYADFLVLTVTVLEHINTERGK